MPYSSHAIMTTTPKMVQYDISIIYICSGTHRNNRKRGLGRYTQDNASDHTPTPNCIRSSNASVASFIYAPAARRL